MSAASRLAAGLSAGVLDNPIAQKDKLVLSRQRGALVGLVLALVAAAATAGAVALNLADIVQSALYGSTVFPIGRTLTGAVAGATLALASLLVPSLASMTLAPERESGTLRLLLTTALTPGAIVTGKLLSVLYAVAAPLLLGLPLLAAGALFSAVTPLDVLFCVALLVVNVVALAAVGVAASATSERVRAAPARALAFAMVLVWGPIGIPSLALVITWVFEGYVPEMLSGVALALCCCVVVVGGALIVARDAIAPSVSLTRRPRRVLVALALVGIPLVAAASLGGFRGPVDTPLWSTLYLLGFGGLLVLVITAELALRGAHDGGTWRAAARVALLSSVGVLLAAPVVPLSVEGVSTSGRALPSDLSTAFTGAAVLGLWLTLAALMAGLATRSLSTPLRRAFGTGMLLLGLLLVPGILSGLFPVVPRVDPATLISTVTHGVVRPFDGGVGANDPPPSVLALVFGWVLCLSIVCVAGLRERMLARR